MKAAALLVALGPELSAAVLRKLPEDDIERITFEVSALGTVAPQSREAIMEEMFSTAKAQEYVSVGSVDYARKMLEQALRTSKAEEIVRRIAVSSDAMPFAFLREVDPVILVGYLQKEHPQTAALILAHLPSGRASEVLRGLPADIQGDVSARVASMSRTAPEVVRDVAGVMRKKLSSMITPHQEFAEAGGLDALVRILKQVDRGTEKTILESMERADPKLADEIKQQMFVFDNITQLDDRSIQRVLREVDMKDLGLALKGTTEEVRERILRNMSDRASKMLEEDMVAHGPVRVRHVEEAQGRIVGVIRRLDEAEEILISRGGEDDILA